MIFTRKGRLRALSVTFVAFVLFVQFYAHLYQLGLLGPISVLSTHFVSWSSYSFIAIMFAGALPVIGFGWKALFNQSLSGGPSARATNILGICQLFVVLSVCLILYFAFSGGVLDPRIASEQAAARVPDVVRYWMLITFGILALALILHVSRLSERLFSMTGRYLSGWISNVRTSGSRWGRVSFAPKRLDTFALMVICPLFAVFMLNDVRHIGKPPPVHTPKIVELLRDESSLELGGEFAGYTSTFWSQTIEENPEIAKNFSKVEMPYWRYALARQFFQKQFSSTIATSCNTLIFSRIKSNI